MAKYRLSRRAAADVEEIAEYSIERFGIKQARRYRDRLEKCFQILAEKPRLGRSAEQLAPDLQRFEHESHIVFYIPKGYGVLIVRVLHEKMDVPKHF